MAEPGTRSRADLVADVRRRMDSDGYAYVTGVPDSFNHAGFAAEFGDLMSQYDGRLVWDLMPEPGMDDVYHSRNIRALVPHTEAYEYPGTPPRYLGLWCVQPAEGDGGETTLADGYAWLSTLTPDEREQMYERRYEWHSSAGLDRSGIGLSASHPVLERHASGRIILRYSANNVSSGGDPFLDDLLRRGGLFFDACHVAVRIDRNCLLIWDNWRMMHSRTSFTDRRRHLRRVLVI
jgi:alpha-ketoglutarate-dependent taurine dioxygenase